MRPCRFDLASNFCPEPCVAFSIILKLSYRRCRADVGIYAMIAAQPQSVVRKADILRLDRLACLLQKRLKLVNDLEADRFASFVHGVTHRMISSS